MTQISEVGWRIASSLANRVQVDVGAAFMTYEQAKEICDQHNLLCNYWIPSKTFVFQKANTQTLGDRVTIHTEPRSHLRTP